MKPLQKTIYAFERQKIYNFKVFTVLEIPVKKVLVKFRTVTGD